MPDISKKTTTDKSAATDDASPRSCKGECSNALSNLVLQVSVFAEEYPICEDGFDDNGQIPYQTNPSDKIMEIERCSLTAKQEVKARLIKQWRRVFAIQEEFCDLEDDVTDAILGESAHGEIKRHYPDGLVRRVTVERSPIDKNLCVVRYFRDGESASAFEYQAGEEAVVDVTADVPRFVVPQQVYIGGLLDEVAPKYLVDLIRQRQKERTARCKAAGD